MKLRHKIYIFNVSHERHMPERNQTVWVECA